MVVVEVMSESDIEVDRRNLLQNVPTSLAISSDNQVASAIGLHDIPTLWSACDPVHPNSHGK